MSKLNQSLKQELLRASEPRKLFFRAYGGSKGNLPAYNVDADCEPSQGYEDAKYCYAVINLFTDDKTIELNKFLSRHYNFKHTHGHIEITGCIGFRRRKGNDFSIDMPSLNLRNIRFADHSYYDVGLLDRDASQDLLQAITEQFQSTKYRVDAVEFFGRAVADYEEKGIPF